MKRSAVLCATLVVLAIAGCGSSSSVCSRWSAHALAEEQAAWSAAKTLAHSIEAPLPAPSPVQEHQIALADFEAARLQLQQRDGSDPRWARAASAGCRSWPALSLS